MRSEVRRTLLVRTAPRTSFRPLMLPRSSRSTGIPPSRLSLNDDYSI